MTHNTANIKTQDAIRAYIDTYPARSAWTRGVKAYAVDLYDNLVDSIDAGYTPADTLTDAKAAESAMLNGAKDWAQYSWGGCALCYDYQIAEALCSPSELKRTRNGERRPNSSEEWLDVQARALYQAARIIENAIRAQNHKEA